MNVSHMSDEEGHKCFINVSSGLQKPCLAENSAAKLESGSRNKSDGGEVAFAFLRPDDSTARGNLRIADRRVLMFHGGRFD